MIKNFRALTRAIIYSRAPLSLKSWDRPCLRWSFLSENASNSPGKHLLEKCGATAENAPLRRSARYARSKYAYKLLPFFLNDAPRALLCTPRGVAARAVCAVCHGFSSLPSVPFAMKTLLCGDQAIPASYMLSIQANALPQCTAGIVYTPDNLSGIKQVTLHSA